MQAALDLDGPPLPDGAAYVWGWYGELAATAPAGGMGPPVITHMQIEAWARLRQIRPEPIELDWLFTLDDRRLAEYAERQQIAAQKGKR